MNSWGLGQGGYVFISHSHDDIEKVRKIRNAMEAEGYEPLCFYLRCLTDADEIEGLIKREIDARDWFVYVDSENARKSKWVKKERAYISSSPDKKIITVNLDGNLQPESIASKVMDSMRVYISYSVGDKEIVERLVRKLVGHGLKVFTDADILPGADFVYQIAERMKEASAKGCIVSLVSEKYVDSQFCLRELAYAQHLRASLVPVLLGDVRLNGLGLDDLQMLKTDAVPTDEQLDDIVDSVEKALLAKYYR